MPLQPQKSQFLSLKVAVCTVSRKVFVNNTTYEYILHINPITQVIWVCHIKFTCSCKFIPPETLELFGGFFKRKMHHQPWNTTSSSSDPVIPTACLNQQSRFFLNTTHHSLHFFNSFTCSAVTAPVWSLYHVHEFLQKACTAKTPVKCKIYPIPHLPLQKPGFLFTGCRSPLALPWDSHFIFRSDPKKLVQTFMTPFGWILITLIILWHLICVIRSKVLLFHWFMTKHLYNY